MFITSNIKFDSGCVKIANELDNINIFEIVNVAFTVLPFTFLFILVAIIIMIIEIYLKNCFGFLNKYLLKFLKIMICFSITSVLTVSAIIYWLGFAGDIISVINSSFLSLIIGLDIVSKVLKRNK